MNISSPRHAASRYWILLSHYNIFAPHSLQCRISFGSANCFFGKSFIGHIIQFYCHCLVLYTTLLLPRDAMQARPMPSCDGCLSICLFSCPFVNSVKTNKHIFKKFSRPSHSSFSVPNCMAIFRREPEGVECRWGWQKSRF